MGSRQRLAHRDSSLAPSLADQLVLSRELVAFVASDHGVQGSVRWGKFAGLTRRADALVSRRSDARNGAAQELEVEQAGNRQGALHDTLRHLTEAPPLAAQEHGRQMPARRMTGYDDAVGIDCVIGGVPPCPRHCPRHLQCNVLDAD